MKNKLSVAAFVLCLLGGAAHTANAAGGTDDIYKSAMILTSRIWTAIRR